MEVQVDDDNSAGGRCFAVHSGGFKCSASCSSHWVDFGTKACIRMRLAIRHWSKLSQTTFFCAHRGGRTIYIATNTIERQITKHIAYRRFSKPPKSTYNCVVKNNVFWLNIEFEDKHWFSDKASAQGKHFKLTLPHFNFVFIRNVAGAYFQNNNVSWTLNFNKLLQAKKCLIFFKIICFAELFYIQNARTQVNIFKARYFPRHFNPLEGKKSNRISSGKTIQKEKTSL